MIQRFKIESFKNRPLNALCGTFREPFKPTNIFCAKKITCKYKYFLANLKEFYEKNAYVSIFFFDFGHTAWINVY